jgi:hypothetical protein
MSLKASISPSAPAPPLKNTEFASFAALDEMEGVQLPAPPAHSKSQAQEPPDASAPDPAPDGQTPPNPTPPPVALPPSAPRVTATMPPSDFGPIGSPPSSATRGQLSSALNGGSSTPGTSPRGSSYANGANLGTSPQGAFISGSPFSAPGTQSVFLSSSYAGQGVAASLGSGLAMKGGRRAWPDSEMSGSPAKGGLSMLSSSVQRSSLLNGNPRGEYAIDLEYDDYVPRKKRAGTVDDGDMEDFIPGSLTDLLTPEERNRRMSRSAGINNPHSPAALPTNNHLNAGELAAGGTRFGHRYSSSVPAPSLLGDIKSIWSDPSVGPLPSSPSHRATPSSSYVPRFEGLSVNGGQQGTHDDMSLSVSMGSTGAASSLGIMAPSNASAAFLPGIHQNYLKSKQQAQLGIGGAGGLSRGLRGSSNPLFPSGGTATGPGTTTYISGQQQQQGSSNHGFTTSTNNNNTSSAPISQLPTYRAAPSPFDLTQPMHQAHHHQQQQHLHHHTLQQQQPASRPIPTSDNSKRLGGIGLGYGGGSGTGGLGVGGGVGGGGGGIGGGNGGGGGLGGGNGINNGGGLEGELLSGQFLSPTTRALQAHAPGQSLPQGLAAGYSRIHALPPLTSPGVGNGVIGGGGAGGGFVGENNASSSSSSNVVGGGGGVPSGLGMVEEWGASSLPPQTMPTIVGPGSMNRDENAAPSPSNAGKNNNNGAMGAGYNHLHSGSGGYINSGGAGPGIALESGLTYSAATKGAIHPGGGGGGGVPVTSSPIPPGLMKGRYAASGIPPASGGNGNGGSPLRPRDSDDDELFAMDK